MFTGNNYTLSALKKHGYGLELTELLHNICTKLLHSLTAEWLEPSPLNIGVGGSNPRGLKCDKQKGFVGGWIYPEYSVAGIIPVVGFDS